VGTGWSASTWSTTGFNAVAIVLSSGVPLGEVARDRLGRRPRRERLGGLAANPPDLLRNGLRDRNLPPDPRGHLAGGVGDGRDVHALLLLVDLGDPPHLAALDERLARPGEVDDEPLVEGADTPTRGHIVHLVG